MQNAKSTAAMKLAHRVAKTNRGITFSQALRAAWQIVKNSPHVIDEIMAPAKRIVAKWYNGTRFATPSGYIVISVWRAGIINKVKRWFNSDQNYDADIVVRVIL